MATTRWCIALKRYLRQCDLSALRMVPEHGWIVLRADTVSVAAVLIGGPFPPREALRTACRGAAPATRLS